MMESRAWLPAALLLALVCCEARPDRSYPPPGKIWSGEGPLTRTRNLDALLFNRFPDLIISLNGSGSVEEYDELCAGSSEELANTCSKLLDVAAALELAQRIPEPWLALASSLTQRARHRLNRVFSKNGLAYYLDTSIITAPDRTVLAASFSIERVLVLEGGPHRVEVVVLRRGDRLSWSHALLGMTAEANEEVVVFLDSIENDLGAALVPSRTHQGEAGNTAELVRRAAASERIAPSRWVELERLVAARHAIRLEVRARARSAGLDLATISSLGSDPDHMSIATRFLRADELAELEKIEIAIARNETLAAIVNARIHRVGLHEAQHRIDLRDRPGLEATAAERSATLAEMANSPATAWSSLARLVELGSQAGAHQSMATALLDDLGGELEVHGVKNVAGTWLSAFDSITADELAEVARELWKRDHHAELFQLTVLQTRRPEYIAAQGSDSHQESSLRKLDTARSPDR